MAEKKHAVLSPSSSQRWLMCPASVALSKGMPNESSAFAQEGTIAHEFAEQAALLVKDKAYDVATLALMVADEEMRDAVDFYARTVAGIAGAEWSLFEVECGLSLDSITGEENSNGTADCLIVTGTTLHVVDFKYGRGVKVEAERNTQLAIYALAAMDYYGGFHPIENVVMHIVQPRLNHYAKWEVTAAQLTYFRNAVAERAELATKLYDDPSLVRDEHFDSDCSVCQFCLAKSKCPKFTAHTANAITAAFPDLAEQKAIENVLVVPSDPVNLAKAYGAIDALELWIKTVRETMHRRLNAGEKIEGYKLVTGRPGNRKWKDEKAAEALMKKMRVREPEMYEKKLISPTKAERLTKTEAIGPRQWKQLEELIERPEGKPAVALETDPRPAITLADDFTHVEDRDGSV